jgi:hypothetical protein
MAWRDVVHRLHGDYTGHGSLKQRLLHPFTKTAEVCYVSTCSQHVVCTHERSNMTGSGGGGFIECHEATINFKSMPNAIPACAQGRTHNPCTPAVC